MSRTWHFPPRLVREFGWILEFAPQMPIFTALARSSSAATPRAAERRAARPVATSRAFVVTYVNNIELHDIGPALVAVR